VTEISCPECHRRGAFELASAGELRCSRCATEFDPHADRGDPNAPNNTMGLTSDAIDPDGTESGMFWCPDCGKRVTRGPSGIEYGHRRGMERGEERCERRPATVDTVDARAAGGYAAVRARRERERKREREEGTA
jgi:DNA-directed RNA polymerase subunit RPC12/RpoP